MADQVHPEQEARFKQMAGKNLIYIPPMSAMFFGSVHPSTKAFVDWMRGYGVKVYLACQKDALYEAWKKEGMIDGELFCNLDDTDNACESLCKAARESGVEFHGVFSRTEQWQPLVGQVCDSLGVPGNPASAYSICRNKHLSRVCLRENGLNTPSSAVIRNADDIPAVMKEVPFPLVVKPTAGAGSMGVFRADNEDELRKHVENAFAAIAESTILSTNPGVSNEAPVMVEQFLEPHKFGDLPVGEFDVDLLLWDGKCVYGRVCDNWLPAPPYFLENGSNLQSVVPENVQKDLTDYSVACVKAMGFKSGAFHVECMYTKDGCQLIEVNPRVGGGPDEAFHQGVTGVHMTQNFLLSCLNIPIAPPIAPKDLKTMVHYDVCCPITGKLEVADFLDHAKEHPWVAKVEYYVESGVDVIGYDTQLPQWLGAIWIDAPIDKAVEAVKVMEQLAAKTYENLKVTPKAPAGAPQRRGSRKASVQFDDEMPTV